MNFLPFIISAVLSALLTYFSYRLATKHKLAMQKPRARDLHTKPISRLGGIAIVVSFLLVMIGFALFAQKSITDFGFPYEIFGFSIDKRLLGMLLASIFLSVVMLFDDLRGLPAYLKFLSQIAAALILILTGVGITYLNNPFGLAINLDTISLPVRIGTDVFHFVLWADLLFIAWVILLTNATNFIDGLDGLAGSLTLTASVILAIMSFQMGQGATATLALVFAGAIFGFLFFNLPPAKIFLGDTGSMFLGLILATLTFITGGKLATVFLVFSLVIIDAIYVIAKRLLKRQNPFTTSDQSHLHHRFIKAGLSQQATLLIVILFSLAFGLSALYLEPKLKIVSLVALSVLTVLMFISLDSKAKNKNPKLEIRKNTK